VRRQSLVLSASIFLAVLAARLCSVHVLWVDEAYPLAAAARLLHGDVLYRDIWFDKPPLYAWVYLLWERGRAGCCACGRPLRHVVLPTRRLAARRLFGPWEDAPPSAAGFLPDLRLPSATVPLAPDLLVVPLAWVAYWRRRRATGSWRSVGGCRAVRQRKGSCCSPSSPCGGPAPVGVCWPLRPRSWPAPDAWPPGSAPRFIEQVWRWGLLYSRDTSSIIPVSEGLRRTLNWAGFHAALVAGRRSIGGANRTGRPF